MHRKIIFLASTLVCGLALTLALMLILATTTKPVCADPGVLYVAPGGNCNGVSPCYEHVQVAVDAAVSGDEIRVASGTYTGVSARAGMTQVVYISKTIIIRGGYTTTNWTTPDPNANPTTLDAQGQGRVLLILGEVSPTVEGLRITGGNADFGGGVAVGLGAVILRNNRVFSNTAEGSGGGLYLETGVEATVISSNTFAHNASGNCGGGMLLNTPLAPATVSDNTVSSNTAELGGGICGGGTLVTYTANIIRRNTIISNTASTYGGGVWLEHSADILNGNIIVGNIADSGGGLGLMYRGNTTLVNNVVADNQANKGSGLYVLRFTPHLLHNTIAHNSGGDGIGIYIAEDLVEMEPSTVTLTNTILVSHTVGITVTAGSTVTLEATLWGDGDWANQVNWGGGGTISHAHDITGTPAFVAPDAGDYHIGPSSAAMDRGIDAGVEIDIDGDQRPIGPLPDLGADERRQCIFLPLVVRSYQ